MSKKFKILLSAYACEPNKGSEPGVGWRWALELSRLGHSVYVLTRKNNQELIENEIGNFSCKNNINFIYYDLWKPITILKMKNKFIYAYYILWQFFSVLFLKNKNKIKFDFVHHITFGSLRYPLFYWLLNLPFVIGPVGGGEIAPYKLRKGYSLKGKIIDFIRDISVFYIKMDPFINRFIKEAFIVFVTTEDTKKAIGSTFFNKVKIQHSIGVTNIKPHFTNINRDKHFSVLYIGRALHWKGMHLGIKGFNFFCKNKDVSLTLRSEGSERNKWEKLIKILGCESKINWIDYIPSKEMSNFYSNFDVMLFPSLHDSGGQVVLEALANGLPVICLDLGGPGQIVNNKCGRVICTKNKAEKDITNDIALTLEELYSNCNLRKQLSEGALKRAKNYEWSKVVSTTYAIIEKNFVYENTPNS